MSTPAPGWYPDPTNAAQQRYYDGEKWTEHTAPAAAAASVPPPPAATGAAPASAGGGFGAWWGSRSSKARTWMIVSAVIVALLIIGGIARAFGSPGKVDDTADQKPAVVVPSSTPAAATPTPSATLTPEPAPAPVAADPVYFKAQANGHLDDMLKDLDDMVVTLDEGGFWRLLSNTGELAFNIGQLEALDVPANVQQSYTDQLAALNVVLDQMTTVVGNQDDQGIRSTIDQMRVQIETVRQVVNQAA